MIEIIDAIFKMHNSMKQCLLVVVLLLLAKYRSYSVIIKYIRRYEVSTNKSVQRHHIIKAIIIILTTIK